MLAPNILRLDPGDGSPVVDYRIDNGRVESRALGTSPGPEGTEKNWRQLTPEELTFHVLGGTIVARWLSRRIGIFGLIRACSPSTQDSGETRSRQPSPSQLSA